MSEGQLLEYREVLSDFALREIDGFFKNLPVVQRARWRWVFPEPGGVLGYPRQRVRRELEAKADWYQADVLSGNADEAQIAPHNRTSPVFKTNKQQGEQWAATCLTTTTKLHDHLPPLEGENSMFTSLKVYMRMIDTAASQSLLRAGGIDRIRSWAYKATPRQRSALSQLLLSLGDFLTAATQGNTETKSKYGPKKATIPEKQGSRSEGSLGRPSTAPIVSAAQKKLEDKIKAHAAAAASRAAALKEKAAMMERPVGRERTSNPNESRLPMKWPMKEVTLQTATQHQMSSPMTSIGEGGGLPRTEPSLAGKGIVSILGRAIGDPSYHGDAQNYKFIASATKSLPSYTGLYSYKGVPGLGGSFPAGCPPMNMRESHLNYDGTLSRLRASSSFPPGTILQPMRPTTRA